MKQSNILNCRVVVAAGVADADVDLLLLLLAVPEGTVTAAAQSSFGPHQVCSIVQYG
jgi:hypothetical protein